MIIVMVPDQIKVSAPGVSLSCFHGGLSQCRTMCHAKLWSLEEPIQVSMFEKMSAFAHGNGIIGQLYVFTLFSFSWCRWTASECSRTSYQHQLSVGPIVNSNSDGASLHVHTYWWVELACLQYMLWKLFEDKKIFFFSITFCLLRFGM